MATLIKGRRLATESFARLARNHRDAVRHERLIARLARGRVVGRLPAPLLTVLVARVASALGPYTG